MIQYKTFFVKFTAVIFTSLMLSGVVKAEDSVIFEENFDRVEPWDGWVSDNGVWDIGTPIIGPETCHSGSNCAATVLDGNFPKSTDSRLISPSIQLPEISGSEEIHLHFRNWFSYGFYGRGFIQVSTYDEDSNSWSDWETLDIPAAENSSPTWSRTGSEITNYSGKKIKIAFYHTAVQTTIWTSGWYIDDVTITLSSTVNVLPTYDSSTGILHIPRILVDADRQYEVELGPPYNILSVTPK